MAVLDLPGIDLPLRRVECAAVLLASGIAEMAVNTTNVKAEERLALAAGWLWWFARWTAALPDDDTDIVQIAKLGDVDGHVTLSSDGLRRLAEAAAKYPPSPTVFRRVLTELADGQLVSACHNKPDSTPFEGPEPHANPHRLDPFSTMLLTGADGCPDTVAHRLHALAGVLTAMPDAHHVKARLSKAACADQRQAGRSRGDSVFAPRDVLPVVEALACANRWAWEDEGRPQGGPLAVLRQAAAALG